MKIKMYYLNDQSEIINRNNVTIPLMKINYQLVAHITLSSEFNSRPGWSSK